MTFTAVTSFSLPRFSDGRRFCRCCFASSTRLAAKYEGQQRADSSEKPNELLRNIWFALVIEL